MFALIPLASILLALGTADPAAGCEEHAFVRVEIDPLPDALSGMRVEFHKTMGPQLILDNPTSRTVEVLDETGFPFVRIGPGGVEGNLAAAAWYTSYSPAAIVPASVNRSADPQWVRASVGSSFGWFESRLDASKLALPPSIVEAGRATDLETWSLPLRVDGEPVTLSGRFRYEPPPQGAYRVYLTSASELAPGVRVRLLPGRTPGLLLENSSLEPVLVLGTEGEPFLLIGPNGVAANLRSPTWWTSGRSSGEIENRDVDGLAEPRWRRVSQSSRFSWIEPRAGGRGEGDAAPRAWRVPLQLGGERIVITGVATWRRTERLASVAR